MEETSRRHRMIVRHRPFAPLDPSKKCVYTPDHTIGPTCEQIIEYDCSSPPKEWGSTDIRDLNDLTFIVGSKYDIKAKVEDYTPHKCTISGCEEAMYYEVKLKWYITLIIHVDILIILGYLLPATRAEITHRSWEEYSTCTTDCFCCDEKALVNGDGGKDK